jgi:hypothetical protein
VCDKKELAGVGGWGGRGRAHTTLPGGVRPHAGRLPTKPKKTKARLPSLSRVPTPNPRHAWATQCRALAPGASAGVGRERKPVPFAAQPSFLLGRSGARRARLWCARCAPCPSLRRTRCARNPPQPATHARCRARPSSPGRVRRGGRCARWLVSVGVQTGGAEHACEQGLTSQNNHININHPELLSVLIRPAPRLRRPWTCRNLAGTMPPKKKSERGPVGRAVCGVCEGGTGSRAARPSPPALGRSSKTLARVWSRVEANFVDDQAGGNP